MKNMKTKATATVRSVALLNFGVSACHGRTRSREFNATITATALYKVKRHEKNKWINKTHYNYEDGINSTRVFQKGYLVILT